MPPLSILDRCKLVGARLKEAKASGDLTAELALQIRLDQLLDQLHRESAQRKDD
ncbi:hypothetical protein [Mycolicibacter heraklionensis]|uniref:hypothetical protein n=1 Tax=Mycolicibacter heraklionensis TaxID=512402 RepID=UPI000A726432|nr:hypothetical protein [Mycolicibacter heraklionensis]